jgi:hypothetical protein
MTFVRNNAVALLALFVALGGTGYAASGGFTTAGKLQACVGRNGALTLLKSGKSCRHGQHAVTWNQTGPPGPPGPSGTSGLNGQSGTSATIPAKVTSAETATTALTANNALSLGGVPASQFTQRDCTSLTGQIKGFVKIARGFESSTFTPIGLAYNCSGQPVEAKRISKGFYEVRFVENPAVIALATTASDADVFPTVASIGVVGHGDWSVLTSEGTESVDEGFELLVP